MHSAVSLRVTCTERLFSRAPREFQEPRCFKSCSEFMWLFLPSSTHTLNHFTPFTLPVILWTNQPPVVVMSSTGQATSSPYIFQSITNALEKYAKQTGIDLTENAFLEKIERSNSPEAILELLLQGREKTFKEYHEGRLMSRLSPVVEVFHPFSGITVTTETVSFRYSTTMCHRIF